MHKIFNAMKIFVTGIFLCGIIFIGGKASAAEIEQDTMQIFRETILQTSKFDNRVFHQNIFFIVPRFKGELNFFGATEKDSLKLFGSLEFWTVDDNGNDSHNEFPFYLVQDSKKITLYFQDNKKWKKTFSPVAAANFIDMFATPNSQEINKMIEFVKEVNILNENDKYRTLLVKLDGGKFIEEIKSELSEEVESQKQLNYDDTNALFRIVEDGFKNADIWYTWTVNKNTWQTDTMSFNLSNLIQSIASVALNNPAVEAMSELREILGIVAFYSEFKTYTTFFNSEAKARLEITKNVLKAKEVKSFSEDSQSKK